MRDVNPGASPLRVACPRCNRISELERGRWLAGAGCVSCGADLHPQLPFELSGAAYAAQVQDSQLPLVVNFAERDCTPCILMDAVFEQAARHRRDLRFALCRVEEEPTLIADLRIRNAPTLVCFDQGRELTRTSGTLSLGQLLDWLSRHLGQGDGPQAAGSLRKRVP